MKLAAFLWLAVALAAHAADDPETEAALPPVIASYFGCPGPAACEFIDKHWRRDTVSCATDPRLVFEQQPNAQWGSSQTVIGQIRYLGMFAKKYHYVLNYLPDHTVQLSTTVGIKNRAEFTDAEIAGLQSYLDRAADIWSEHFQNIKARLRTPYNVRFRFKITDNKTSFFHVNLMRGETRGPYDTNWSLAWQHLTLAHEMGHVMGLDDEYKNDPFGGDSSKCIQDSLMCRSRIGLPKDFHYYLILRRMACSYNPILGEEPYAPEGDLGEPGDTID